MMTLSLALTVGCSSSENNDIQTSEVKQGEEVVVATSVAVTEILDKLGVKVSGVPTTSYELPESVKNATEVGSPMNPDMEIIKSSLDNKEKNDEKVMILFGAPGSVMIGTDKSYTGNLVQICGGNNVFNEGNSSYIQVNMEEIIKANPDKILVTMHALPDETKKTVAEELAKDSWKSINAVKNNKVIYLDSEYFGMSANLKVIEALDLLGDILYEQ